MGWSKTTDPKEPRKPDPFAALGRFAAPILKDLAREEAYKDRIRALEAELAGAAVTCDRYTDEAVKAQKERDAAIATQNRLAEAYKQMSERQEDTAAQLDEARAEADAALAAKNEFVVRANVLRIERDDARAAATAPCPGWHCSDSAYGPPITHHCPGCPSAPPKGA